MAKERKSNRRTNRSVFVGLPQRIPKPMKDESRARKGEQERTNCTNTGIIESLIQTKENDSIDGVYAFPQGNKTSDTQSCNEVQNKELDCVSNSKLDSSNSYKKMSTQLPASNKQDLGNNKENIFRLDCNSNVPSRLTKLSDESKYFYANTYGSVVQSWISANPGLTFNHGITFNLRFWFGYIFALLLISKFWKIELLLIQKRIVVKYFHFLYTSCLEVCFEIFDNIGLS